MKEFLFEYTPRTGENLIARPLTGKFLIPIAKLRNESFIIPDDPEICLIEFMSIRPRAYHRTHARRVGRALCLVGIPVFDERGRIRVYCPRRGGKVIFEAFQFHNGYLDPAAELLRNYAEIGDYSEVAKFCGEVKYQLDDEGRTLVVEGVRRYRLPPGATLLKPPAQR